MTRTALAVAAGILLATVGQRAAATLRHWHARRQVHSRDRLLQPAGLYVPITTGHNTNTVIGPWPPRALRSTDRPAAR